MSLLDNISAEDFLRAVTHEPYVMCPVCGKENACGTNVIARRHFSRRCIKCGEGSSGGKLPDIDKKIIYLDQCVLGFILRALMYREDATGVDPLQIPVLENFLTAFSKLDLLNKKQQLLCPQSDFHFKETTLMPEERAKALKKVNVLLSSGNHFKDSRLMIERQVFRHFDAWLQGKSHSDGNAKTEAVSSNVDDWSMWINVTVSHKIKQQDIQNLLDEKNTNHAGLAALFPEWQKHGRQTHEYFKTLELTALGKFIAALKDDWSDELPQATSMLELLLRGIMFPFDLYEMSKIFYSICEKFGVPDVDRKDRIESYFSSGAVLDVPFFGIASQLTALIAQRAAENKSMKSDGNDIIDILFMSLFLPFTDAVLMERKWHRDLQGMGLSYKAQVFSVANIEDFFNYLDDIEAAAPPAIMEKVREVYGDFKPYYTVHKSP